MATLDKFSTLSMSLFHQPHLFVCVFHINIVSLVLYTNRVLNVYLQPKSNKGNMMTQQHGTLNPRFVWPHKRLHVLRWIGSSHLHPLAQTGLPKSKALIWFGGFYIIWMLLTYIIRCWEMAMNRNHPDQLPYHLEGVDHN